MLVSGVIVSNLRIDFFRFVGFQVAVCGGDVSIGHLTRPLLPTQHMMMILVLLVVVVMITFLVMVMMIKTAPEMGVDFANVLQKR